MTRRLIAVVALRIIGLLWLGEALSRVVQVIVSWLPRGGSNTVADPSVFRFFEIGAAGHVIVLMPLGIAFLLAPRKLAAVLFPDCGDEPVAVSTDGLGSLAFRVLGMVLVVHGVLGMLRVGVQFAWDPLRPAEHFPYDWRGHLSLLAYSIGSTVIGVILYRNAMRLSGRRAYQGSL